MNESPSLIEEFDLLVLGSGEGGKYLAWNEAKKGSKVAVIERRWVGGSCPNIACLPSKNIIHTAKVASYFKRSEEFGISLNNWKVNIRGVMNRKRNMVADLVAMHLEIYKKSGAELVFGSGSFIAPKTIAVKLTDGGSRILRGKQVVINTGSRAALEPIPGLAEAAPLTHIDALELDVLPERLLIVGGGYVGLEFAQAMSRLGSKVLILERNSRLVHNEDEDISEALHNLCLDEGIEIFLNTQITAVEGESGSQVKVSAIQNQSAIKLAGTHLLIASGRTPNTDGIGLDLAGVELTSRKFVKVNERLETTAAQVWAIGDCAGSPHFTHISFDDFRVVRDNIAGGNHVTTGRQVPFCLFTDPEFARVGLSEAEAKKQAVAYHLAKIPMATVLRTQTLSETRGFMKALIDPKSHRILGFACFGVNAGEIMGAVQIAILAGLPCETLRDAILTHPTMLEGLVPLFSTLPKV